MLILILIDVQYSQNAVFSYEKGSNRQNHSSSPPGKKIRSSKISDPHPPPPTPPTGAREFTTSPLIAIWEILFTAYSYFTEAALRWLLLPCQ